MTHEKASEKASNVQSVLKRNRAGLHLPTTGSGCPTKSLEPKLGFGKAKFGGKGVARRGWHRRNSSGSGSAHHIPLHVTNLRMAIRSRLPGNEARSDHDFAVSLAIPCVRNMLRERWYSMRRPWLRLITECPPVRERRRRCWYATPFRRFARLVSIFGYIWPYSSAVSAA